MVVDRALAAAGDRELLDSGSLRLLDRVLDDGLSTTGSISFGIALVAGRKRVPSPATGKTALRTGFCIKSSRVSGRLSANIVAYRVTGHSLSLGY